MARPESSGPRKNRPYVCANFALTADGRISTKNQTPAGFGSARDQRILQEIRADQDAILAGVKTIAADRMSMGLVADLRTRRRQKKKPADPLRVMVSNRGNIPADLPPLLREGGRVVIFSTTKMPRRTREALMEKSDLFLFEAPRVPLSAALRILREDFGVQRLVCEGGGTLMRALLEADLIDEIFTTFCPLIFGGKNAPTLTGQAGGYFKRSVRLQLLTGEQVGDEYFCRWKIRRPVKSEV